MGEAKRRKAAESWRQGGRVEDFRVAEGTVAITIDIDDIAPSTLVFAADKIAILMEAINEYAKGRALDYYGMLRYCAKEFPRTRQTREDPLGVASAVLWTALYHPTTGAKMRELVSRTLREKGRAHITWKYSSTHGLAMAIADQFADLDGLIEHAPRDRQVIVETVREPERRAH